jgi:predicted methyltransferase MtxX (methanogen marker protein 4)
MLNVTMKMKIVRMKLLKALSKQQDEELEGEESDEDDTSEVERVTTQNARNFIDRLRRYFMQEGNEGSPLSALDVCADFVHSQSIKRTGRVHWMNSSGNDY